MTHNNVIRENDHLKIAREEMLASKVLAGKGMILDSTNFPFAFAMKEGIVIPDDNAYEVDLKKLKLFINEIHYSVSVPIDINLLPTSTQSLLGMPVRLYGPKGACSSIINGFMIVSKKIPHFGEIQRWKEEKTPRKKIALNISREATITIVPVEFTWHPRESDDDLREKGPCAINYRKPHQADSAFALSCRNNRGIILNI